MHDMGCVGMPDEYGFRLRMERALRDRKEGKEPDPFPALTGVLEALTGVAFFFLGLMVLGSANALIHVLLAHRPLFVICLLIVGLAMYQFKASFPITYGLFAIGFGLACGEKAIYNWHSTALLADQLADWTALGAAAYVISRGAEDVSKGRKAAEDARKGADVPK